jgi:hypothetical protein
MALSLAKKQRVNEMLAEDKLTTTEIAKKLRVPKGSVAALKAHMTMSKQPRYFEVTGTFLVQGHSRSEALNAFRPVKRGVGVVSSSIDECVRLSEDQAHSSWEL